MEPPQSLLDMGARFYRLPPYQRIWEYVPTLYRYLKQGGYQIIHAHINTLCVFPLGVAWAAGIPVRIAHSHSAPRGYTSPRDILKVVLRFFAHVFPTDCFACSEQAGRWLFGDRFFERGRVELMYNAVDFTRFVPSDELRREVRVEWGLSGRLVVGHVGRFTLAKNHRLLLEIFSEIRKRRPDAALFLVGDGELREEIDAQIKALGLEQAVVFAGVTDRPERYYPAMDVVVLPSLFEGLPMTALEAQACRVPLLLSGAIPEEAVFCDRYHYLTLNDSPAVWAEEALRLAESTSRLEDGWERFDVHRAAKRLEQWYLDKLAALKK